MISTQSSKQSCLLIALVACLCTQLLSSQLSVTQAQPVPDQEQSSRLIRAAEQLSRDLAAHKTALENNTRALQELNSQLRMRPMNPGHMNNQGLPQGPSRPW